MLRIPDLEGRAVLITGASTGIGAALARGFAAQGAKVGLHYNSSGAAAEAVAAGIEAAGGTVRLIRADAADPEALAAAVEEAATGLGRLDGLINNAGSMVRRVDYAEAGIEDYAAVMDLNARSVVVASRAAIPHLKAAAAGGNSGFIINTTSIAGRNGASGGAGLYGSSKAFVANVTRGMAKELAPFGIRVNAVAPGVIETPFQDRFALPGQLADVAASVPAGRLGSAEDCVGAYLFLASPGLSAYVIGQELQVNGGQLMI
ncbi:SDR family NAD(P)-dependent oxidoreductase [Frigidibacter sp. ROC022]|uniref:SDR family NAD(P)-dependent oxidoreductase n=1 Tax=Frigidibacter sp. ROC022 TaxID=2971796 RepID=UPI00215ABB16|nr:SDR family oxidoreductase [Frigidibacter sp. ROC022]MCR8722828.1 SDR family oxidoreductase [Frigidibacter sp. ROC022]